MKTPMKSRLEPRWVIASSNPGKISEITQVLGSDFHVTCLSLKQVRFRGAPPEESGKTYRENARLKAYFYAKTMEYPVLADDSGLEVKALGAWPGLKSARIGNNDAERRQVLLRTLHEKLGEQSSYQAQFVCALAFYEKGMLQEFEGVCKGEIRPNARGQNGFGYDPIFYLKSGRSMAELSPDEKNQCSHRAVVLKKLRDWYLSFA
jgi:XTP/dITP diphosphohydrolase